MRLHIESVQTNVLISAANKVISAEVARAGNRAVPEILNPRLINLDRARSAVQWMPVRPKIIRPIICSGPMATDECPVVGETYSLGNSAGLHVLQWPGCKS